MDASAHAFTAFLARLRPMPEELATGRAAAAPVAAALRRHFRPDAAVVAREDHLIAGSYGKRTAIRPLPAVDLLYLLPASLPADTAIRETVTAVADLGAGRAVADHWRVTVDVAGVAVAAIPCLEQGGAFLIPGEDGGWRTSNPAAEAAALRLSDALSGGRVADLLALAKAWRLASAAPIEPFALELLAREFVAASPPAAPNRLFADFLVWARRQTPGEFDLPGGAGRLRIGDAWHGLAEAAYWRCVLAERQSAAGEAAAAAAEWQRLLGPLFPAPTDSDTEKGETR